MRVGVMRRGLAVVVVAVLSVVVFWVRSDPQDGRNRRREMALRSPRGAPRADEEHTR